MANVERSGGTIFNNDQRLLLRAAAMALMSIPVLFFLIPSFIVRFLPSLVK
ncbi:MAG: hypothetical protein P4M01_02375 [Acidobacteriota bacterium]|nr:hypothetical protein [Acidobacteriota bacterium]